MGRKPFIRVDTIPSSGPSRNSRSRRRGCCAEPFCPGSCIRPHNETRYRGTYENDPHTDALRRRPHRCRRGLHDHRRADESGRHHDDPHHDRPQFRRNLLSRPRDSPRIIDPVSQLAGLPRSSAHPAPVAKVPVSTLNIPTRTKTAEQVSPLHGFRFWASPGLRFT